jgi:hypothetical protein
MEEPVPRLLAAAGQAGVREKIRVLEEGTTALFAGTPELAPQSVI